MTSHTSLIFTRKSTEYDLCCERFEPRSHRFHKQVEQDRPGERIVLKGLFLTVTFSTTSAVS